MKMKSLKTKVTVYVVIIVTVAIMACTFANVVFSQRRMVSMEEETLQVQAERYANEINGWIAEQEDHAVSLAETLSVMGIDDRNLVQELVTQYYQGRDELLDVYVGIESDGAFIRANPDLVTAEDYDPRVRGWYTDAKTTKDKVVENPYLAISSQKMVTTIAAPIFVDDKVVAVVGIDVTIDEVVTLTDSIDFADNVYGFLVDEEGNIVTHKNEDYLPTADSSTNVKDVAPELEPLLATDTTAIVTEDNYEGNQCYFASAAIDNGGWIVCIAEPTINIKGLILNEILLTLAVGIVCLIIVIILMVWIIGRALKPVEPMVEVVKNLSNGYFDSQLDRTNREDEIGVLQNSLANLIGILQIVIEEENYILGEVAAGNLDVEEMTEYPGEFNDLSLSVNSIPITLNGLLKKVEDAAMNLEGTIIAIETADTPEERAALAEMLSGEAKTLMEMLDEFKLKKGKQ